MTTHPPKDKLDELMARLDQAAQRVEVRRRERPELSRSDRIARKLKWAATALVAIGLVVLVTKFLYVSAKWLVLIGAGALLGLWLRRLLARMRR